MGVEKLAEAAMATIMVSAWNNVDGPDSRPISDKDGAGGIHTSAATLVAANYRSTYAYVNPAVVAARGFRAVAVDLTAGEKERSTAETTMLLPLPRSSVLQGKILAVSVTAVMATFLNLLALGLSAEHLLASLSTTTEIQVELPVLALVSVAPWHSCSRSS